MAPARVPVLAAAAAVLCVGGLLALALVRVSSGAKGRDFGIMLDAGSSGTRLYVYEWPARADASVPLVEDSAVGQRFQDSTRGISSFADDPAAVGPYIAALVDEALPYIDEDKVETTPIYLKATAGMRLLPDEDQAAILAVIRSTLAEYPLVFEDSYASVITGEDEGVFGWVTVNYLLDTLGEPRETLGALDLGGASTQISFVADVYDYPPAAYGVNLTLGDTEYPVYVHSYLGYGRDQANLKYRDLLADAAGGGGDPVADPCLASGLNETDDEGRVFVGQGDAEACLAAALRVLDTEAPCEIEPCSFDGVHQPPVPLRAFVGFGAFAFTSEFFDLDERAPLTAWEDAVREFCPITAEELDEMFPGNDFVKEYCFNGAYILALLRDGYGISETSNAVECTRNIDGVDVGWTLGAMIYEANLLAWNKPSKKAYITKPAGIAIAVLLGASLAVLAVYVVRRSKQQGTTGETSGLLGV